MRTETGVDAPRAATLANQLCVEVRVHLHQQPRPAAFLLQMESIRRAFPVQRAALHKETATLLAPTNTNTIFLVSIRRRRFATVAVWSIDVKNVPEKKIKNVKNV